MILFDLFERKVSHYAYNSHGIYFRIFSAVTSLHKFEVSQLVNLCPENAEEAKALIPSLEHKLDEDELESLLRELHTKKSFQ